ncbi:MAG: AAA family ATPase [Alphaproteobacteria bacterium]
MVAFLSAPGTFGEGAAERVDTHISHVFLYGQRVWKLKRPVDTGFLDFSTREARRRACERELEINRRISGGDLYVRLRTVTQEKDGLALDGPGRPVDWLVEMKRFDPDAEFDVLARRGKLTEDMIVRLARRVAHIHEEAPRRKDCGGSQEMRALAADTISGLMDFSHPLGGMRALADLSLRLRRELNANARLLDARRRFGRVRHCHADLHLANICLYKGEPTPFDAIEFNDRMASIDIVYDAAFTIMDLIHEGLDDLANRFLNAWAETSRDYTGLRLLPLSMALRAAIRARVLLLTARLNEPARAAEKIGAARSYFDLALRLSHKPRPLLLAAGGVSGTGKSTLAQRLALDVAGGAGAVILRSDVIRKRIFGQAPEEPLPEKAYRTRVSKRVFAQMFKDARRALAAGSPVIMDATFMDERLRERAALLAGRMGVPFRGLWLDAPDEVLVQRIAGRGKNASDATAEVLARQRKARLGVMEWSRIDASGGSADVHRRAREALSDSGFLLAEEM